MYARLTVLWMICLSLFALGAYSQTRGQMGG